MNEADGRELDHLLEKYDRAKKELDEAGKALCKFCLRLKANLKQASTKGFPFYFQEISSGEWIMLEEGKTGVVQEIVTEGWTTWVTLELEDGRLVRGVLDAVKLNQE